MDNEMQAIIQSAVSFHDIYCRPRPNEFVGLLFSISNANNNVWQGIIAPIVCVEALVFVVLVS